MFMAPLLLLFLRDGKQGVHILFDCLVLLDFASGSSIFDKKRVLLFSECGQFLFHALRRGHRNGAQLL